MDYPRNTKNVITLMVETIFEAVRVGDINMNRGADLIAAVRDIVKMMELR